MQLGYAAALVGLNGSEASGAGPVVRSYDHKMTAMVRDATGPDAVAIERVVWTD